MSGTQIVPSLTGRGRSPTCPPSAASRKSRQRRAYNCAECRRLKLKCDRQVPCANCIKRQCSTICPDGSRSTSQPTLTSVDTTTLSRRVQELEALLGEQIRKDRPAGTTVFPSPLDSTLLVASDPELQAFGSNGINASSSTDSHDLTLYDQPATQPTGSASPGGDSSQNIIMPRSQTISRVSPNPSPQAENVIPNAMATSKFYLNPSPAPNFRSHGRPLVNQDSMSVSIIMPPPSSSGLGSEDVGSRSSDDHERQAFGSLMLGEGGRSRYYGPTAGGAWLNDQEGQGEIPFSRPESPIHKHENQLHPNQEISDPLQNPRFPFAHRRLGSVSVLLNGLPSRGEAKQLIDSYRRYFAWHYDVVSDSSIQTIADECYTLRSEPSATMTRAHLQRLGLFYAVLAMGNAHNLELAANDESSEEYISLAQASLSEGKFMDHNTIQGLQALHIMAHSHLEWEKGRGDSSWPLWGLTMRLILAMGLHRDGDRWGLSNDVIEERRRVFWECHAADVLQAHCFSRPCSILPAYIDTAFPAMSLEPAAGESEKDFARLKFELSSISAEILDAAMRIQSPQYTWVQSIQQRMDYFERTLPFYIRCRTALSAQPSYHPDVDSAIRDSPDLNKKDLRLTLQQFTLATNISETVLFLHRPYYAKSIYTEIEDPMRSPYAQSYLIVVERCNIIISLVSGLFGLYPNVAARMWFLWFHAFNAAVCLCTLMLRKPQNILATFALSHVDTCINLYTQVVQIVGSRRMVHNLSTLIRLRARGVARISQAMSTQLSGGPSYAGDFAQEEDLEFIGWRTRLIERASTGSQVSRTINVGEKKPDSVGVNSSPGTLLNSTVTQAIIAQLDDLDWKANHLAYRGGGAPNPSMPEIPPSAESADSADAFLQQFWAPELHSTPNADIFELVSLS